MLGRPPSSEVAETGVRARVWARAHVRPGPWGENRANCVEDLGLCLKSVK